MNIHVHVHVYTYVVCLDTFNNPYMYTCTHVYGFLLNMHAIYVYVHVHYVYSVLCLCFFVGMDYHFYREEIYVTLDSGAIHFYSVSVSETQTGTLMIGLSDPNPTQVYATTEDITLGDIAVDWVYDVLYWIESSGSSTQVYTCMYVLISTC